MTFRNIEYDAEEEYKKNKGGVSLGLPCLTKDCRMKY
jgi:hypothetical protein